MFDVGPLRAISWTQQAFASSHSRNGYDLGSLDKVTRIVRLGVWVATSGDVRDQPKVADAASELLQDVFGKDKSPCRLVYGVASLPLGTPVELEVILEVAR